MMRITILYQFLIAVAISLSLSCGDRQEGKDPTSLSWEEIEKEAQGTTVQMMMWQGDPFINSYMTDFVVPELKKQFNIELEIASGQGNQIVNNLMTEMEAGKSTGSLDLIWINGETFFQLREIDALYGPFVEKLPNAESIDLENPFIGIDFQQGIEGMECPWGNVQLALIYNSELVPEPPVTMDSFSEFVNENPGTFTIPTEFTGMTLLKSWLIELAGGPGSLDGGFSEEKYQLASQELWKYLDGMRDSWWQEGQTVPSTLAQVHQLYANRELWFTMSNNDGEVDNKVLQGLFPESSRSMVFKSGTIQNSHYLGIPKLSANKSAALVVINFLISQEAQFKKMQPAVWGDGTVLNVSSLDQEWQQKFAKIPGRERSLSRDSIQAYALKELDPEYMIRLYEDYRAYISN